MLKKKQAAIGIVDGLPTDAGGPACSPLPSPTRARMGANSEPIEVLPACVYGPTNRLLRRDRAGAHAAPMLCARSGRVEY